MSGRVFLDTNILIYADDLVGGEKRERSRAILQYALIVKCAAAAGCPRLITEALQHGQVIAGVRIENPFRI